MSQGSHFSLTNDNLLCLFSNKENCQKICDAITDDDSQLFDSLLSVTNGVNSLVKHKNEDNEMLTLLHVAIASSQDRYLKHLLMKGASVNSVDSFGSYPIHKACARKEVTKVKLLIGAGSSVNCQDGDGMSPLMFASLLPNLPLMDLLIEEGADVNLQCSKNETSLMKCCKASLEESVAKLLSAGAKTNFPQENKTALRIACCESNVACVRLLLSTGACVSEVEISENNGETLLGLACANGDSEIVSLLLDYGADPNPMDSFYEPLTEALNHDDSPVIAEMLVVAGANLNVLINDELAFEECEDHCDDLVIPLVVALGKGYVELARLMMKYGVKKNKKSSSGVPPVLSVLQSLSYSTAPHKTFMGFVLLVKAGVKLNVSACNRTYDSVMSRYLFYCFEHMEFLCKFHLLALPYLVVYGATKDLFVGLCQWKYDGSDSDDSDLSSDAGSESDSSLDTISFSFDDEESGLMMFETLIQLPVSFFVNSSNEIVVENLQVFLHIIEFIVMAGLPFDSQWQLDSVFPLKEIGKSNEFQAILYQVIPLKMMARRTLLRTHKKKYVRFVQSSSCIPEPLRDFMMFSEYLSDHEIEY